MRFAQLFVNIWVYLMINGWHLVTIVWVRSVNERDRQ